MKWNDIARKLTSRKLWLAIAGFVAGIMLYCGAPEGSAEGIASIIMSGASVIGYAIGEGLADAGNNGA